MVRQLPRINSEVDKFLMAALQSNEDVPTLDSKYGHMQGIRENGRLETGRWVMRHAILVCQTFDPSIPNNKPLRALGA